MTPPLEERPSQAAGLEPGMVSVIVPVYNRTEMLVESVESALAQAYRPLEIIIVDDGSTDGRTPGVVASLEQRHPEIRAVRRENGGPGLARETGRQIARGEFIQYLDSDDLLLPGKLERQVTALRESPECGIAYGRTRFLDADGNERACTWKDPNQVQQTIFPSFLVARWWETATPLYRRTATDAAGPWTDLRLEEDWEYDARMGAHGVRLAFVSHPVAAHRDHREGRLSRGAGHDPHRLRQRARAHALIYRHARTAGITPEVPEMQRFARELFLISRQAGAAGLPAEAKAMFLLSREASGPRASSLQFRLYSAIAGTLGWAFAGKLARVVDHLRW